MAVRWAERFQIYVLNVGNLAAGASVVDLPLPLDSDAPFVLRGRGGRCQNDPRYYQAGMNSILTRFRRSNDDFSNDAPVPWYLDVPGGGYGGAWKPVYPQEFYPQRGTILTSVYNTGPGAVNLTNVQLYYVGTKLFPASTPYTTYPKKCSVKDFIYSYWAFNPLNWGGAGGGVVPDPLGPSGPVFQNQLIPPETNGLWDNIPLTIQNDADFALRSLQAGIYGFPAASPTYGTYFYMELFMLLMDQNQKPYMNAPVHIDWLCGGGSRSVVTTGVDPVFYLPNNTQSIFTSLPGDTSGIIPGQVPLTGNWHPGLIYPEIYIPANQQLYYNLSRNDSSFTTAYEDGGGTAVIVPPDVNLHIAFTGSKVFHK